jgi:hypothetical protein
MLHIRPDYWCKSILIGMRPQKQHHEEIYKQHQHPGHCYKLNHQNIISMVLTKQGLYQYHAHYQSDVQL